MTMNAQQEANARRFATMWRFDQRPNYELWRDTHNGDIYELWADSEGEVVKVVVNGEDLKPNEGGKQ